MTSFPMFISLEGKPCLIVGGGNVAARKCRGLLAFGADVTVIAEKISLSIELHNADEMTDHERVATRLHMTERSFQERDVAEKEWALVIAATDDREVNSRVARLCHERNIPVNVADCQTECTFFFPAYCKEENIAVGITTSGKSPEMASALRKRLEAVLPEWIEEIKKTKRVQKEQIREKKEIRQDIGKDVPDNG